MKSATLIGRNWARPYWPYACLALALVLVGARALLPVKPSIEIVRAKAVAASPLPPLRTCRIEDLRVGMRVLGSNPHRHEVDHTSEPTPGSWRQLDLMMLKSTGKRLDITLLRRQSWLDARGARVGASIPLDIEEMGAVGPAEVLAIRPCPPIETGPGYVILGTFCHEPEDHLVNVWITGLEEPIGCTPHHRFWSETRGDYVEAGSLRVGESLRSRTNQIVNVRRLESRPWEAKVYNLEVHSQHVYEVSLAGVLVHNTYPEYRVRAGEFEILFGNYQSGLQAKAERMGAKWYGDWDGKGTTAQYKNNWAVLAKMEDAKRIHFSTEGLTGAQGKDWGILDYAYHNKPVGRVGQIGEVPTTFGTAEEMGMALQLVETLSEVPLVKKTMFHRGPNDYVTAKEFITSELQAGKVKLPGAQVWLREILNLFDE